MILFLQSLRLRALNSRILGIFEMFWWGYLPQSQFWNLALYSLGYTISLATKVSSRKLRFGMDHGISFFKSLAPDEEKIPSKYWVTWSPWRINAAEDAGFRGLLVEHPWIAFRQLRGYEVRPDAAGTLIFTSHSVPGVHSETSSFNKVLSLVQCLPEEMQPVSICLHMHDVRRGHHLQYIRAGLDVRSAGNSLSPKFADRFYRLAREYRYALSETLGSQVFYLEELGLKSFIADESVAKPFGDLPVELASRLDEDTSTLAATLFSMKTYDDQAEQRNLFLKKVLGIGMPRLTRQLVRSISH